jgi:hypothetical protein
MTPTAGHGTSHDDELDPDEPKTPLWLPFLGLCLFLAVLIYVLVGRKHPLEEAAPAAAATTEPAME